MAMSARRAALYGAMSRLLSVPTRRVDELMELVDDPSCWHLGPWEGSWTIRVPPEPTLGKAFIQFLRLPPGATLPMHPPGEEHVLVLEGDFDGGPGLRLDEGGLCLSIPGALRRPLRAGPRGVMCLVVHQRRRPESQVAAGA